MPQITAAKLSDSLPINLVADDDGNLYLQLAAPLAGERNTDSNTNGYFVTKQECNRSVLSDGTGVKNIGASGTTPVFILGVYIHTALVGTLTITGFTTEDGVTAASVVIPIGAVGQVFVPGNAGRCDAGCTMQKSSASDDDKIVVDWRPIV